MGYLTKRQPKGGGADLGADSVATGDEWEEYPALLEFLASTVWPEGGVRQPGTLLVFVDEGRLKACLSDRAQGLVAFVSGCGLVGLLRAAEALLRDDTADWRAQRGKPRGK